MSTEVSLTGLAGDATFASWWADPVAAMAVLPWILSKRTEGLRVEMEGWSSQYVKAADQ